MTLVLIVSKTRMASGVCVSGLTSSNQSVRLIPQGRRNQAVDTPYEIGQVWDIDYAAISNEGPPHVEDVRVMAHKLKGHIPNLRECLLSRIQPWIGGPECLFDGKITLDGNKAYISESGSIPLCSTGYWLPDKPLNFQVQYGKPYYVASTNGSYYRFVSPTIDIKFVGLSDPVMQILPGTLVRVSLARWFQPEGASEERCYLQVSGWYDR